MTIVVRTFALARDAFGFDHKPITLDSPANVATVWQALCDADPSAGERVGRVLFAVNRRAVDGSCPLRDGDELAILPPPSGG